MKKHCLNWRMPLHCIYGYEFTVYGSHPCCGDTQRQLVWKWTTKDGHFLLNMEMCPLICYFPKGTSFVLGTPWSLLLSGKDLSFGRVKQLQSRENMGYRMGICRVYVDYIHTHQLGELQGTAIISPFQEEKGLAHIILHTPYKSVSYKDKDLFIPNQRCALVLVISSETPTNKFFRILHFEFIACIKHQNRFLGIFQFEARILEFLPTSMISWTRQHVPCIDDSYS